MSQVDQVSSGSVVRVGIGTFQVTDSPGATLASTPLGTCLAVVMHDETARISGLLNSLLPQSSADRAKAEETPALFLDTGFEALLEAMESLGAQEERLLVYAAGGCEMLDDPFFFGFQKSGGQVLAEALAAHGMKICAVDTGGFTSRSISIDSGTGAVSVSYSGNGRAKSLCK